MSEEKACPLCEGRGTLKPDPDDFLIEELGDSTTWRKRKADAFFSPFLPSDSAAKFLHDIHFRVPSSLVPARYIRSQTFRIIDIADVLRKIGRGNDVLIMLLVMVAENVAKLWFGYKGDRESKKHVRLFFIELTPLHVQAALVSALKRVEAKDDDFFAGRLALSDSQHEQRVTDIESAVNLLYRIRCDVVHEGRYREFLRAGSELGDETYMALRECVVRGSIAVLDKCVKKAQSAAQAMREIRLQAHKCAMCQETIDFGDVRDDDVWTLASEYSRLEADGGSFYCQSCWIKRIIGSKATLS